MKNEYDFLFTDKIPFLYFEKTKIVMKDGFLVALNGEKGIEAISVASTAMIILGYGTSITQEAALECSKYNCLLVFSRGGFNFHTILQEQRFKNTESLLNQFELFKNHKLDIAKEFLKLRLMIDLKTTNFNEKIESFENEFVLMGNEANYYKKTYKKFCEKFKIEGFTRDKDYEIKRYKKNYDFEKLSDNEKINGRLNITNNVLYSYCAALAFSLSLEPSLGFIHGETRRGGLSFDLADIIKIQTTTKLSFNPKYKTKDLIINLRNELSKNNFLFIKIMIEVCTAIANKKTSFAEDIYEKYKAKLTNL